jgi:hypothetical protein
MESKGLVGKFESVEELQGNFRAHLARTIHNLPTNGKETAKLAKSAENRQGSDSEPILTPNLVFDLRPGTLDRDAWFIVNLGSYAASIQAVFVQLLNPSTGSAVGRGFLKTDQNILLHWRKVIGPGHEIRVSPQRTFPSGSRIQLSGLVRLVFYFVYGSTGARIHALDVKVTMASSVFDSPKLHDQHIRLDERPPQLPATSIDQIQPVRQP